MGIFTLSIGTAAVIPSAFAQDLSQWSKSVSKLTIFQPGDAVRIRIWDLYQDRSTADLGQDYPINPDGFIVMPLIGQVRVKDVTPFELQNELQQRFAAYLKMPYVLASPLIRITLQGSFNKPGVYYAEPSSSVWNTIALAGGPDGTCNLSKMRVERGGRVAIKPGKFFKAYESGSSLEETGVESGDQIIGPARGVLNIYFFINIINLFATIILLYLRIRTGQW